MLACILFVFENFKYENFASVFDQIFFLGLFGVRLEITSKSTSRDRVGRGEGVLLGGGAKKWIVQHKFAREGFGNHHHAYFFTYFPYFELFYLKNYNEYYFCKNSY